MGLSHLDHYNIEVVNLDETIKFYCDVLGLKQGFRPPIARPGAWLYAESGHPSIHLLADSGNTKSNTGCLHHICFAATDKAKVRDRLVAAGIPFNVVVLPRVNNTQFFMQDPNGINVELNFPPEETTPEDVEAMNRQRAAQAPATANQ